jgi:hypothetical protein
VGPVTVEAEFPNADVNQKADCQLFPCYCTLLEVAHVYMGLGVMSRLLAHARATIIS